MSLGFGGCGFDAMMRQLTESMWQEIEPWWERNNVMSSDLMGITRREATLFGYAEEENKS